MFEKILPSKSKAVLKTIAPILNNYKFYLAGGTGLALQLGHRISNDFDFFANQEFDSRMLAQKLKKMCVSWEENLITENTVVVIMDKVRVSFFYYDVKLSYALISFKEIPVADWRDIIAEKFKVISQRGSKKDFYDIYEIFVSKKLSIEQAVEIFKNRFVSTGINYYHVLKSLAYFEDAESDPAPKTFRKVEWKQVKKFFTLNIKEFEKQLIN